MSHIILLYYKYTPIADPTAFMRDQKLLCNRLHLKGRILISKDGMNGTVSGTKEATDDYMAAMRALTGFEDIEFKIGESEQPAFPKMKVKTREEIITLKAGETIDMQNTAPYIEPEELYNVLKNDEDVVVIDARNEYEARIGKFKNAVTFDIENFRELPELALTELEKYKDKEIVTYCTGGVRCEPFSAFLRQHGFTKVRQLHGGIIRYAEHHPEFGFDGHCYVFDNRVSIKVNDNIFSACEYCHTKSARYINCKNDLCHRQLVCCEKCDQEHQSLCPQEPVLAE